MKFTLIYTKRATKDIRDLDTLAQKRLAKKLVSLANDPVGLSYRYRVGDYRVVFDLMGAKIVILRVGHRREIYQ